MKIALNLAYKGVGRTAPNPSVGCVIVNEGRIVGRAVTADNGRPHAETIALKQAGKLAKNAALYVTLEPCSHEGKTPPCVNAIIDAQIAKVVIATKDISEKVCGAGIKLLRNKNIEVITGICQEEARRLNAGFFMVEQKSQPFITLKLATSLDGKIALSNGHSKWITSSKSREFAHLLRSKNDAIMVGVNTILHDNPMLNCRLAGLENRSPIKIILDSNLKTPSDSNTLKNGRYFIFTTKESTSQNANIIQVDADNEGRCNIESVLKNLADMGITNLLVEGGAALATSLLKRNLVDKIIWITAPKIIGNDGISAISDIGLQILGKAAKFKLTSLRKIEDDIIAEYEIERS